MAKGKDNSIVEMRNDTKLADIAVDKQKYPGMDKVGEEVLHRLRDSAAHRNTAMVGGKPLGKVLKECFNQKNGVMTASDQELIDAIGNDAYVNLTDLKTVAAEGIFKDNIIAPGGIPFYVGPTPIPTLPDNKKKAAVRKVIEEALARGEVQDEESLMNIISEIKKRVIEEEEGIADDSAKGMNKLIKDQCEEGGYRVAMTDFIRDFVLYPYAVMEGPVLTYKEKDTWKGSKFTTEMAPTYIFRRVSPFDLYWTPDSTNTQDGTGVTIVERMSIHNLSNMMEHKSFRRRAVERVLERLRKGDLKCNWIATNAEARATSGIAVRGHNTVDVLRHYGVFLGQDLIDMGVEPKTKGKIKPEDKLNPLKYYECTAVVVAGITIQLAIGKLTGEYKRPVHTASYESVGTGIPGVALAQKIRDVERVWLSVLRALVCNANFASKPITEIDFSRLMKNVSIEDMLDIIPGQVIPTDGKAINQSPALRFHDIPSQMAAYSSILQQFMDLADRVTQIPAAMHGEPVGTGANRTFRGIAMLQGNVLKTIASASMNIDQFVHRPMGEILYRYNMLYSEDQSIKGDSQVIAEGATTMLQKEVKRQNLLEALQLVGQVGVASPDLINWMIVELLDGAGIPESLLNGLKSGGTMQEAPPQQDPQAGPMMPPGELPPLDGAEGSDIV